MVQCPFSLTENGRCELEEGHSGPHTFSAQLPPDIGQLMNQMMDGAEEARERALKAFRSAKIMLFILVVATALNVGAFIASIIGMVAR